MKLHMAKDYIEALHQPHKWPYLREDEVPVHDEDLLLEARIHLELGKKDAALRTLAALDASTGLVGQKRAVVANTVLASKKRIRSHLPRSTPLSDSPMSPGPQCPLVVCCESFRRNRPPGPGHDSGGTTALSPRRARWRDRD